VTSKSFKFPEQHKLPFFFVSAADGTNVVKVFEQAVEEAVRHRSKVKRLIRLCIVLNSELALNYSGVDLKARFELICFDVASLHLHSFPNN